MNSNGVVVWFTGLPSSGKTRLACRIHDRLKATARPGCMLDGDRIRALLHPRPGYSAAERDDFYLTLGDLAVELADQGLVVLVAATANRKRYRDRVRARAPRFVEVWMNASLEQCQSRDAKGLYAAFARGAMHDVPGGDVDFEAPIAPEVTASGGDDQQATTQLEAQLLLSSQLK